MASGGSLRLWEHLFPGARILGIDRVAACQSLAAGRISIGIADAGDPHALAACVQRHGPFDLVIDDGSHVESDVFTALGVLFEALTPGGLYAIEDLVCELFPDRALLRDDWQVWRTLWPGFCGRLVAWALARRDVAVLMVERCQLARGQPQGQCVTLLEKAR